MATKAQQYTGRLYTQPEVDRMLREARIAQVQRLRNALDYTLSKTIKRENLKRHLDERIAELSQTLKDK